MNKKYWENFYLIVEPTPFAKFCLKYMPKNAVIWDLGCGNGRDTYFFGGHFHNVTGLDYAFQPHNSATTNFFKCDFRELLKDECNDYNNHLVIYSRFFLHSITTKEIIKLIKWTKGTFMAEFRDKTDKPKLYKDHKRNLIDGEMVKDLLVRNGFKIRYYSKSRGLARYKNEDPVVVRIIAEKYVPI